MRTPILVKDGLKLCSGCKEILPVNNFHKNSRGPSGLQWHCKLCCKKQHAIGYQKYKQKYTETSQKYYKNLRIEVLTVYGNGYLHCMCCGETQYEFLSLDHINGGGNKHRREVGGKIFNKLKQQNFPPGYQTLCHNCNQAKGHYGICPHVKKYKEISNAR